MSNFFDDEYEKMQQEQQEQQQQEQQRQQQVDDWYVAGGNGGGSSTPGKKRPIYVALICFALVLAIVFGWVMCSVFNSQSSNTADAEILSTVMQYLEENYYQDISDSKKQAAIAAAGTAMLQSAGDKFCQLMSPQQYYDYMNQTSNVNVASGGQGYFGIVYSYTENLGLYVSDVQSDSSCYGLVFPGDIILKISNIEYNDEVIDYNHLTIDKVSDIVVADYDSAELTLQLAVMQSASFHILRGAETLQTEVIERGDIGFENVNPDYEYDFIEFYFSNNHNNISTENQNKAKHNTYELRGLSNLPEDTGYIRIVEFMYYRENNRIVTAATEFAEVMSLFKTLDLKRLVLDLKGNPGGLVDAVCDIAGMLVTDANLTEAQKRKVNIGNQLLITTLVPKDASDKKVDTRASTYTDYFAIPSEKCNIVVWTDGNSASASELLTGALTDYGTGFQIGTKTYGKGIAQTIQTLNYTGQVVTQLGTITQGPWAIYYTFAAYYSPLGTNIHGTGYTPKTGYDNVTDYVSQNGSRTLWEATFDYWG